MRARLRILPAVIVVLILSQFDAAIACSTKEQAYAVAMRSNLRDVVMAEAAFRDANGHYTSSLDSLSFSFSRGIERPEMTLTDGGWWMRVHHERLAITTCAVAVGSAVRPGEVDGQPFCNYGADMDRSLAGHPDAAAVIAMFAFLGLAGVFWLARRSRPNSAIALAGCVGAGVLLLMSRYPAGCTPSPLETLPSIAAALAALVSLIVLAAHGVRAGWRRLSGSTQPA